MKFQIYIENKGGYETIQKAINAAEDDDSIYILNGTYSEMLIIDKSINLIGENTDTTFIDYQGPVKKSENIILINSDYCSIEGLSIIGNISYDVTGISINSSNNIITNVVISNTSRGIKIDMEGEPKNNHIYNNTLFNNEYGIHSMFGNENNISDNIIFSNSEYGMYIQLNSNNNIISNNKIYNNNAGIRLKGSKFNNVLKNELENNSYQGLYICCGAEKNYIYNNSFNKNSKHVYYTTIHINYFYRDGFGNYWDDYVERYPNAIQLNGVWDMPYEISNSFVEDKYPLVEPVEI